MTLNKSVTSWYKRTDVKFEIAKRLFKREFALFVPSWYEDHTINTRMLKIHNVAHYDFVLKAMKFFDAEKPYNFYYSLAKYKNGIPHQTMNLGQRQGTNYSWKGTHENFITQYDLLIDIDCPSYGDMKFAHESCIEICKCLTKLECPHQVRFSGKGFHIIIDGLYFNHHFKNTKSFLTTDIKNIYFLYSRIAHYFHANYSELVDKYIYDSRRVCKIPFSIALYEKENYICYPFQNRSEFLNFKLKDYTIPNFNKKIRLHESLTAFWDGSVSKLIKEVNKNG